MRFGRRLRRRSSKHRLAISSGLGTSGRRFYSFLWLKRYHAISGVEWAFVAMEARAAMTVWLLRAAASAREEHCFCCCCCCCCCCGAPPPLRRNSKVVEWTDAGDGAEFIDCDADRLLEGSRRAVVSPGDSHRFGNECRLRVSPPALETTARAACVASCAACEASASASAWSSIVCFDHGL